MINRLFILLLISGMLVACKGQKKVSEMDSESTSKPEMPGPGELKPDQAILVLEITEALETSVKATFVSVSKRSFGFSANLQKGQIIEVVDVPDELLVNGAIGKWVVEQVQAPGKTIFRFISDKTK